MTPVIIRNRTLDRQNIHLAVHPFKLTGGIRMLNRMGDYDEHWKEPMAEWQKRLSDALWDEVPGLQTLFFENGEITLQHSGAFDDEEIVEFAEVIIRPFLEEEARLRSLLS